MENKIIEYIILYTFTRVPKYPIDWTSLKTSQTKRAVLYNLATRIVTVRAREPVVRYRMGGEEEDQEGGEERQNVRDPARGEEIQRMSEHLEGAGGGREERTGPAAAWWSMGQILGFSHCSE